MGTSGDHMSIEDQSPTDSIPSVPLEKSKDEI